MSQGYCVFCGAALEDAAAFCVACGAAVAAPLAQPPLAEALSEPEGLPFDPEGKTIVAEDENAVVFLDVPMAVPDPAATILEEPEPVPAIVRLEIADVESGNCSVEFELGEGASFTIGRDGRVTNYVPEDPRASRRHFSLSANAEGIYLTDMGSSNGTYVNGSRVTDPVWLSEGDSIEYGRSSAVVHILQLPSGPSTGNGVVYL